MKGYASDALRRLAGDRIGGPVMTFAGALAGYVALARCAYMVIGASGGLASFWPPNGLIVALLVLLRARLRPWVILAVLPGELVADTIQGDRALTALGWGAANSIEVALAAWILIVIARRHSAGNRGQDFVAVGAAAVLAPLAGGLVGAAVSVASVGGSYGSAWVNWWLGDATGIMLVASLLLAFAKPDRLLASRRKLEGLVEVGLVIGVAVVVFALTKQSREFLVVPPLVLLAARQGARLTALAIVALAIIATACTGHSLGPLSGFSNTEARVLGLQAFIATSAFVGFLVCGAISSRSRAEERTALQARLLDEVDAAVVLSDAKGVVRYWNRGAQQLYLYTAEEAIGRDIVDLIVPEESRVQVLSRRRDAIAGGPVEGEVDVHDRHGRCFPVYLRLRAAQLAGVDGELAGTVGVSVDISARRQAEQAIRRHAAQQEEIANLGRLALQGDSLAELFDYAVRIASGILAAECARVLERLPGASGFVVKAGVGWLDGRSGEHVASEPPSISGFAVAAREPVVVTDWDQERRFERSSRLLARGARSSIAVRIGEPSCPFGVIEVHYTLPQAVPADCGPFLAALANVLAEAIHSRDAREKIRLQALHDGLTGLPNRTLFHDRLTHALARNDPLRKALAVFLIDIDHFKLVNDSLGHDAGDELLRLLAPRFAGAIREVDTLARLGGDQFAVLCEELPSELAAVSIANQLISSIEQPVLVRGEERVLSASVGIAVSAGNSTATELLRDADAAMYHAKKAGGRRLEVFDQDMRDRVLGRVRTESALRAALANEREIYVHYQPLVSLKTGRIVGAEALARWRHPDWGPVSPIEFIPVAEDSGLIHELGAKVIGRALRECAAWQHVTDFAGIAVNVSTRQLVESDEVPTLLSEAIVAAGVAPGFLTVEVTESVLIEQLEAAQAALRSMRDLGVHLSLDDFGTGYSSLSYLRDLPLDVVKIDRSLIKDIIDTPRAADIPAAIVHMAHSLDLKVIAEGVETIEHAVRLQRLNCDIAQGFYFAKPMAPEQLTELLHNQPPWLPPTAKQSRSPQPKTTTRSRNMAGDTRLPKSEPLPT